MQELLRQNPEDSHHIYQNHGTPVGAAQAVPGRDNSVVYSHIMYDQYSNSGYRYPPVQTTDLDEDDDDLPPAPSPVSSSYSELTRTINNSQLYNNTNNGGPPSSAQSTGGLTEVQKKVQLIQQQQQQLLGSAPGSQQHTKYPMYTSVQAMPQQAVISGGHHLPSQATSAHHHHHPSPPQSTYSNYESIYEPINPRPQPHQFQGGGGGSTYSSYSPYNPSSAASSLYSASQHYGVTGGGRPVEHEVDALTDLLVRSLHTNVDSGGSSIGRSPSLLSGGGGMPSNQSQQGSTSGFDLSNDNFGNCVKCGGRIVGENSGCTAMDQIYHIECFTCCQCQINLQGKPFYPIDNQPFCEEDYLNTLEKCSVCLQPILERILRATGKPYHPQCFTCIVCSKSLDGIPFTVDATNQIYCIEDFHK